MAIQKGQFVELDYVGTLTDTNEVFDVTSADAAKKAGVHQPRATYGPRIICVGERQLVAGLDDSLLGKEENNEYDVQLTPEQGFGKKDPKLLKIVPSNVFTKEKIRPMPGLRVTINGTLGTIKTVSGGRSIVDFNHPLAGHAISYHVTIRRIVKTIEEKLKAVLDAFLGANVKIDVKEHNCTIHAPVPEPFQERFREELRRLIPELKDITFEAPAPAPHDHDHAHPHPH